MTSRGEVYAGTRERTQLLDQGYTTIPDVLGAAAVRSLQEHFSPSRLGAGPAESFGDAGAFIVGDYRDPAIIEVVSWPPAMQALEQLGYPEPKLHNYYISTKPPGAEALPWHSDLFYSYERPEPAELFLIYYLQDTSPANGCLRVVPGSHAWTAEERRQAAPTAALRAGETSVPLQAGDLFIGDRRILHATHPNTSDSWRTGITIAYAPEFEQLPEEVQALIVHNQCLPPAGWWKDISNAGLDPHLRAILPIYNGAVAPAVPSQ